MLKILIADDEENIREGLKAAIYWEQYGYEICGEAENGIDALAMACELRPDLIIADIRMPGMDGLKMVRKFKEMDGNSRIIILSGYSEFQYAKQSIELGVEAYLLKPIDEVELTAQIVRIGNSIMEEKSQREVFNDSIAAARNGLVVKLVTGQFRENILNKSNQILCMDFPWQTYQVMLFDINIIGYQDWDMKNEFKDEIAQFIISNNYGYTFDYEGNMGALLKDVCFDDDTRQLKYLYKLLLEKQKMDTLFVIGPCIDNINDIHLSYEYAKRMLKNKFLWGSQGIIGYKKDIVDVQGSKPSKNDPEKIAERLYTAIDVNSKEYIKMELQELCDSMMSKNMEEAIIKSSFINICFDIFSKLKVKNENLANLSLGNGIYCSSNIEELKAYAMERFTAISDELAKGKSDLPMLRMMDYIRKNYNQQLKIENLAQMFGYNSIYLGQLFKNYTGMYFNTYLEKVRIDRARELLIQGLKVYQVAEQIGFHNLDYFSSKFKKYTGVSPSDYKGVKGTSI